CDAPRASPGLMLRSARLQSRQTKANLGARASRSMRPPRPSRRALRDASVRGKLGPCALLRTRWNKGRRRSPRFIRARSALNQQSLIVVVGELALEIDKELVALEPDRVIEQRPFRLAHRRAGFQVPLPDVLGAGERAVGANPGR